MVVIFSFGLGLACFIISWVQNPGGLHLFVALFMLRFFGQGNLFNVSTCEINYWWVERRGVVMGIAGGAVSAAMLGVIPLIMINLIAALGWRQTYVVLGIACIGFMAPIGGMFFRDKPEKYGLLPDARKPKQQNMAGEVELATPAGDQVDEKTENTEEELQDDSDWTAPEVFRSVAFWVFSLSDLIIAATGTAFFFHLRSVFKESGVSSAIEQSIYPTLAFVSIGGNLFSGWLIDRITQRHVMWIGLAMHAAGLAMVSLMTTDALSYVVAFLIGASGSFCSNVRSTVFATLYGRTHLGKVQSLASSMTVFGSAIGPFPFGVIRDLTGSFSLAFTGASLFPLVAAIVVFLFGKKEQRPQRCAGRPAAQALSKQGF
mmetsp:Transcript_46657/g.73040  ORF Transcript_46657/g.73040 Transcript_46657/m.73040 type:complete len:374 (+) Transcript_46657:66-1187(+)